MAEEGYETPGSVAGASTRRSQEPARGASSTESVEIKKTENGGFVATCYKRPTGKGSGIDMLSPKQYAFSSLAEAVSFLQSEFGGSAPATEPAMDAPAPAPQPSRPMNQSAFPIRG